MKDLEQLVAECQAEMKSIGIQIGTVLEWEVNSRAKNRWGQCKQIQPGSYTISISSQLLQDDVSDVAVKETVIHELLHTVKGCHGHTGRWKQLAAKVNRLLPQYTIKRCSSSEEKGIQCAPQAVTYRYKLRCVRCGQEILRQKASSLVTHPERYRCAKCGGNLLRTP